ncbi:MAG: hypothetical protein R3F39_02955 [Myxococcota bacterium]
MSERIRAVRPGLALWMLALAACAGDGSGVGADLGIDAGIDALTDAAGETSLADGAADAEGAETVEDPDAVEVFDVPDADAPRPDAAPDAAWPPTCDTDAACADGLDCTTDRCVAGHCAWEVAEGFCLVNARCREAQTSAPQDGCLFCDPSADRFGWSVRGDGTLCDDDDACTAPGTCAAGACATVPVDCDDGVACTLDTCDPQSGCRHGPAVTGAACDDADPCTTGDTCRADGTCGGTPLACDDADPCTDDVCEVAAGRSQGACAHVFNTAPCADADADLCTVEGVCQDGVCLNGGPVDCDDGDACTIDVCQPELGCYHLPTENPCCLGATSVCDDGDPCTLDTCDPVTLGCSYAPSTLSCDDGNACTTGDVCTAGLCAGAPLSCDDGDPCTADFCDATAGCQHVADTGKPCDDGLACSTGDTCVQGSCVGDESACVCAPVFAPLAVRVTSLTIGPTGGLGDGLNVDGDSATCQPDGDCEAGIDNAFGILAPLVNDALSGAVAGGSFTFVFELGALANGPVLAAVHTATPQPGCTGAAAACPFVPDAAGLDPLTCDPVYTVSGTWTLPTFSAGGPAATIPFSLPLGPNASLALTLRNVRIAATATVDGATLTGLTGVLAGAVAKGDLLDAIDAAPDGALPFSKAQIKGVISALVPSDIDGDGDGVYESSSIGMPFSAVPVVLVAP